MEKDISLGSWVKRRNKKMIGLVIETARGRSEKEWSANVIWQNGKSGIYRVSKLGEVISFSRPGGTTRRGKKHRWNVEVNYGNEKVREKGSRLDMDYLYEQKERYAPEKNSFTEDLT